MGIRRRALGFALLLAAAAPAGAAEDALARYRTVSAPDCVDAASMIVQYDAAPVNRTYLRVQHMGDPGTAQLRFQVGNVVTWDVGARTGLTVPAAAQRGFIDAPGQSAFQLHCADAGFYVDTATFSHAVPLVGQGPNVSVARDLEPPLPAFAGGAALVVEAVVRVPWARPQSPPVTEGTAQVGFFVYLRDRASGIVVTQVIGLFDDRPPGVNGSGVEGLGHDGVNAFVTSPLAARDALGRAVRFVAPLPRSAAMGFVDGWSEARRFAALVTPAHFEAALALLRANGLAVSADPAAFDVLSFGVNGEVIAGTSAVNEVALGASVSGLALRVLPRPDFERR